MDDQRSGTTGTVRLDRWTQSLFDKADRLLDLADHGIPIPGDPIRLVFSLVGGSRLPLAETDDPALAAVVRAGRDALAEGEHVLWLAVGTLTYLDRAAHVHTAPLILWPVGLERDAGIVKLVASPERAPRINDALIAAHANELAHLSTAELDLVQVLAAADELCAASSGWSVERSARLVTFSFAELDMWKDVTARDLTGPDASVPLQWLLGELAPPALPPLATDHVVPLDADGSQMAAIAAAAAGGSFVLQGPPGTGKSQTIANLLVQCASQGTSVLVVSDRVAALEAIQKRLAAVGLGEVCAIAGQPIERSSRPHVNAPAGAAVVRTRLAEVAAALDGHVRALHGVDRLGFTVHEAMARLVELRTTPRAALAEADAASLDRATFERRKRAVIELGDAAAAVEPVAQHPWRASALAAWTVDGTLRATQAIETASDATAALLSAIDAIAKLIPGLVMRTPEQLRAVGLLAQLAAGSPRPGSELLTGPRGRAGNLDEELALIRARGGGTLDTPRDPISFITIAQRHRALVTEVAESFSDCDALDAPELWAQLKKWTTSMGPLRYIALRTARGAVKARMLPGGLTTDAAMLTALEAVIAERACRTALLAAAEPAARWFGALGGDVLAVDLDKLAAALAWTAELRKAFDQVTVQFGEPGRQTAWRALVAQVAASSSCGRPSSGRGRADDLGLEPSSAGRGHADDQLGLEPSSAGRGHADDQLGLEPSSAGRGHADNQFGLGSSGGGRLSAGSGASSGRGRANDQLGLGSSGGGPLSAGSGASSGRGRANDQLGLGSSGGGPLSAGSGASSGRGRANDQLGLGSSGGGPLSAGSGASSGRGRATDQLGLGLEPDDNNDLFAFAKLADAVARWEPALAELSIATGISATLLSAGPDHLLSLRAQISQLAVAVGSLAEWTRFHLARRAAVDAGIQAPIVAIERGDLEARELALAWERATLLAWADAAVKRTPELAHFDGGRHHQLVTSFTDLDRGAMAVMRGRLPKLAPCVLATPQAVARCALPMFDLVVFDESSRLPVAHALGALARARAAIIVGDVRQPVPADGAHGLLDVALSAGMPELVLTTHYRSRHHDLFAFANRRYYFDLVEVYPAAVGGGLAWREVAGAAEATGANRMEAEEIVGDVKARLAEQPNASLAIVTLSRAQQHLIEDLLEAAALRSTGEPILVGTPDRMQGEERDVVFLSVGEQADSLGALAHPGAERWLDVAATRARSQFVIVSSFAPEAIDADAPAAARGIAELLTLARAGGTPLVADAPAASAVTAAIARALGERGWTLRHRVGLGASAVELAVVDPDDPSRCVLAIETDGTAYSGAQGTRERDRLRTQVLTQLGWRTHRVWCLDWWLDPERETMRAHGAIVAAVAASRQKKQGSGPVSTKTRRRLAAGSVADVADRTTPELAVAEGSGGTAELATAEGSGPKPGSGPTPRIPRGAITIGPYTAAAIPCGRRVPDDMFAGRHVGELAKVVEQVLAAEAPIHVELLARRVAAYFGVGRVTPRIVDQIRSVLDGRGQIGDEPDVVWRADQDPASVPSVRVAGNNAVAVRDITEIPLSEVASAARLVVERASGLSAADLVRDCARLLGFARITEKVTGRVARGVELAASRELIAIENGRAHLLQG